MTHQHTRLWRCGTALVVCAFAFVPGCGVLNPSLLSSTGVDPAPVSMAEGTILIAVFNYTTNRVITTFDVRKDNGGVHREIVVTEPYNLTSLLDYVVVAQDCDVAQIDFVQYEVIPPIPGATGIQRNFAVPPVVKGQQLFCGRVVTITIGTPEDIGRVDSTGSVRVSVGVNQ